MENVEESEPKKKIPNQDFQSRFFTWNVYFYALLLGGLQTSWGRPVTDKSFRQGKGCLYIETDAFRANLDTKLTAQLEKT